MNITTKTLSLAAAAVLAVGAGTAVVLGGTHAKREATIPAGTEIVAALDQEVSTDHSRVGDAITLHTVKPISLPTGAEIPSGAVVHGTVYESKAGGRIAGAPELSLGFTELAVDGDPHVISAEAFRVSGRNDALKSAAQIGGGAVAGGIMGRVLGGKSGTLPGAILGTAIGSGVAIESRGDHIALHSGQHLRIRLSEPVTVTYRPHSEKSEKTATS
jgi:hypothetical protein